MLLKEIMNTEKKAIALAKATLRLNLNVKRLSYFTINADRSMQCDCGETQAFEVTAKIAGDWYSVTAGFCESCGQK